MENIRTVRLVCGTWKTKTLAAVLSVVGAVALPQFFHLLGMASNLGTGLGEAFLPMHLFVFLAGYFAGAWAGVATGIVSPVLSFALTSAAGQAMPALPMMPYMAVELGVYGLTTGLFAQSRRAVPTIVSLLSAQIFGRAVRALALAIGVLGFGFGPGISVIWNSLLTGLPGLVLQWILIPLVVFWVEKKAHRE